MTTRPRNDGFGRQWDVVIGVERLAPLVSYSLASFGDTSDDTRTFSIGTSVGPSAAVRELPRLAVDVTVAPHLSVGGTFSWSVLASGQYVDESGPLVGGALRVGVPLRAGSAFGVWPRLGGSYARSKPSLSPRA